MSDKLPNLNYNDSSGQDMGFTRPYSEETAQIIDDEIKRIINEQYERAKSILKEYARQHNEIRDQLIEHEVIYHDDVERILGPRKWVSRTDEIIALNKKQEEEEKRTKALGIGTDAGKLPEPQAVTDDDDDDTPPPFAQRK